MKRRITVRERITRPLTAASVFAGWLLAWSVAGAQTPGQFEKTLTFIRDGSSAGQTPAPNFTVPPPISIQTSVPIPNREIPQASVPSGTRDGTIERIAAAFKTSGAQEEDSSLVLPGPSRLFKRISEKEVFDEIRMQARRKPGTVRPIFPDDTVISKDTYMGRSWSPMIETVEPNYVGHGRLYFEQPNFERGGWDFGIFQPIVSAGVFYADMAMLPYQFFTRPLQRFESSAGKCLPGDPSPLFLYPPELSATGATAEAATVVGLLVLFPR